MIQIREYLTTKIIKPSIIVATDRNIRMIVKSEIKRLGSDADLNHIDVSQVGSMSAAFGNTANGHDEFYASLNPDISEWDVSNVTDMSFMFYKCESFNCDLSNWKVDKVMNMEYMFAKCFSFNQELRNWNVKNVRKMMSMFKDCTSFNKNLTSWNVSNVEVKTLMFDGCPIEEKYKPRFKS